MDGERTVIARQGTHDGMCGIYCLINAVRHENAFGGSPPEDLLRYLLEAAHRLNSLLPYKISHGYEEHELTDIFNEFARSHDLSCRAHLLSRVQRAFPNLSPVVVSKRVFEEGGQLVLHLKDDEHWVLAFTYDFKNGGYQVEDSVFEEARSFVKPNQVRDFGIVILPVASPLQNPDV